MLADRAAVVRTWGTTDDERSARFPCDDVLPDACTTAWRAVEIEAPAAVVFRWLCQMRVAPYSYDWLDNWGRRSPQELTPGLEVLEVGQRFATIFELVDFEPNRHLTLRIVRARRVFGDVAITYAITRLPHGHSRLVVKIRWDPPGPRLVRTALQDAFMAGDLVMMRRQLLNLKALAERTAHTAEVRGVVSQHQPWLIPPPRPRRLPRS